MSQEPVVSVLIGAEGGYSASGESAQLIKKQLKTALKDLSSKQPFEVRLSLQKDLKTDLQKQLNKVKGLTVDVKANLVVNSSSKSTSVKSSLVNQQTLTVSDKPMTQYQAAKLQIQQQSQALKDAATAATLKAKEENLAAAAARTHTAQIKEQIAALKLQKIETDAATASITKQEKANSSAKVQDDKFTSYLNQLKPSVLTEYADKISEIRSLLEDAGNVGNSNAAQSLSEATDRIKAMKAEISALGKDGGNAIDHLVGKFQTFSTYLISSAASLALVGSLTKAIQVTYDLNAALTDLQIVTGQTADQTEKLILTYNNMAQTMGTTTKNVSDAAVEWLRQGYTMADTQKLIEDSMVLSIVGFMDSDEAAKALTATMKGYQLSVTDAMSAVDKFTAVDMAAATSAGDIATALSKTAANAKLAGISLDDVIGQLARVNETMQEAPETTGTFYNTMLSRLGMIKAGRLEDPETGESLSDVETTLSNLGISLRNSVSEFRNFGEVLDEVGGKWDTYSSVQQRAIATAFAGTRQQTRFIALMEGWEEAAAYSELAANSAGTAMEKFGIYQESLAAKTARVTAAFEKLTTVLVDSNFVGLVLDFGSASLNFLADVGSIGDGAVATIAELAAAMLLLSTSIKLVKDSRIASVFADTASQAMTLLKAIRDMYLASSAGAATAATQVGILSGGIVGLGAALKSLVLAHPFITAAAAVVSLIALIDTLTVDLNEQKEITESLRRDYQAVESEVSSLQSELEDTNNKISEIKSQGKLSLTEAEELERLKSQNQELERQLAIKEKLAEQTYNELADSVQAEYDKSIYTIDKRGGDSFSAQKIADNTLTYDDVTLGIKKAEEAVPEYISEINRLYGYLSDIQNQYNDGLISEEQLNNGEQALNDHIDALESDLANAIEDISTWYDDLDGATSDSAVSLREKLGEALNAYNDFNKSTASSSEKFIEIWNDENLSGVTQTLLAIAKSGQVTAQTLSDPAYQSFVSALEEAGIIGESTGVTLENVAAEINDLAAETEDATEKFVNLGGEMHTIDTALSAVIDRFDLLSSAQKELQDEGTLSLDTLTQILDKFGEGSSVDLSDNVSEYILGLKSASDLLNDLQAAYQVDEDNFVNLMREKLYANESFYNALTNDQKSLIDNLGSAYGVDLSNFKTVEDKKLAIQTAIIQQMMKNYSQYTGYSAEALRAELESINTKIATSSVSELSVEERAALKAQSNAMAKALQEILTVNQKIDEAIGGIEFNPSSFSPTSVSDGISSSAKEVELYVAQIEAFRKELQKLSEVTNKINQKEGKLELIPEDDEIRKQKAMVELIGLYGDQMRAIENLNISRIREIMKIADQLRSVGFSVDYNSASHDFFVENLENLNNIGIGLPTEERNELIKFYEDLIAKAEEYNQANIDSALDYINIQKQIQSIQQDYIDLWKQQLGDTQESLNSILDLVKEMIKQEAEDLIDALEKQSDAYREIIEMKKRSLELTEKEREYQEGVKDKTDEISKLQARIDALSLDDSREAQLEKQKLLEELAQLQEELNDYQHDHSIESQEDALDQDLENFEDHIDDKISEIEDFLNDQGRLTQEAYDRIDREGEALFDDLLSYALKYTDMSRSELEKMWEDALEAAKEYGSFVSAMDGIGGSLSDIDSGKIAPGSDTWNRIINQMKELGSQWGSASPEQQKLIADQSLRLGTMLGATRDENGVWWYNGEKLFGGRYDTSSSGIGSSGSVGGSTGVPQPGSSEFNRIIARMRQLGSQWGSASPERQKELAAESLRLGTSIGAVRDADGVWWYKGQKLFDVYHTGGEVGSIRPKSNEVFALMEKGEVVLNSMQQSRLLPMLEESIGLRDLLSRLNLYKRIAGNTSDQTASVQIYDYTQVNVADKSEFQKYLSDNRRKVADMIAKEFSK